jgi:endoglycosylceramidase
MNYLTYSLLVGGTIAQKENVLELHVHNNKIKDKDGRERIFHGTNVVEKMTPFVPKTDAFDATHSFSKEDAEFIADIGFNTIRLGVLWEGFEPTQG